MRWVVAAPGPQFSVQDVYRGWCEGVAEAGHDVHRFNLDDRLAFYDSVLIEDGQGEVIKALSHQAAIDMAMNGLAACLYKVRPHFLLIVSGFFADLNLIRVAREAGTRVIVLHTECPYEDDRQLQLAGHVDLNLLNDPVSLPRFERAGPSVYVPHAYRPQVHHPGPAELPPCDLAFAGTGYPSRTAFFEAMDLDGLDVVLTGNWTGLPETSPLRPLVGHELEACIDNAEAVKLYRSARAGINLYRREASRPELQEGHAMGPREVEMAASGLFFLRDPRPESDHVLPMLPAFAGPEDASEQLRWWLAHDSQRQRAAAAAREAVADRTFGAHARKLTELLERGTMKAGVLGPAGKRQHAAIGSRED